MISESENSTRRHNTRSTTKSAASGVHSSKKEEIFEHKDTPQAFDTSTLFWQVDAGQVGLDHWLERRERWTTLPSPTTAQDELGQPTQEALSRRREFGRIWKTPMDKKPTKHNLERIYDMCVDLRKPFSRPVNLAELVPVLIAGWQRDGTWPQGQVAPDST